MKNPPTKPTTEKLWDLIDAVLVINLDHRKDRWKQVQEHTADIIPQHKLHRISAVLGKELDGYGIKPWFRGKKRDPVWAAKAGCTLSHQKALEHTVNSGWETVLVLEDDIEFSPAFDDINQQLATALSNQSDWDICYLGYTDPEGPFRKLSNIGEEHSLYQVFGCMTTHAYIVRKKMATKVYAVLPDTNNIWSWLSVHRIIDRWYMRHLGMRFKVTCITPSIINQRADFSDITQSNTDYTHSDKHTIAVPEEKASEHGYPLKYRLQKLRTSCLVCSDFIRGQIKRLNGF